MTRDDHLRPAKATVTGTIEWSVPSWRTATEHMIGAKVLSASERHAFQRHAEQTPSMESNELVPSIEGSMQ